jgi:hypothetical protein
MSGAPSGPPEWPFPGGLLNQPARLVDEVDLLRSEWPHLAKPVAKQKVRPKKGKR